VSGPKYGAGVLGLGAKDAEEGVKAEDAAESERTFLPSREVPYLVEIEPVEFEFEFNG
jgi:hypothetical protein